MLTFTYLLSWLFAQFRGADANFRMVRKKVSSEEADPTLSPGWSYFVKNDDYQAHLEKFGSQKEVVSKTKLHDAVWTDQMSSIALNMCEASCRQGREYNSFRKSSIIRYRNHR